MKLHDGACEMISKVSENKDLKPHECGRSTLSSKNSRLELEQGLKKPHFLHLQFCTCNNSFPRIPSRHNFCLKESPEFSNLSGIMHYSTKCQEINIIIILRVLLHIDKSDKRSTSGLYVSHHTVPKVQFWSKNSFLVHIWIFDVNNTLFRVTYFL